MMTRQQANNAISRLIASRHAHVLTGTPIDIRWTRPLGKLPMEGLSWITELHEVTIASPMNSWFGATLLFLLRTPPAFSHALQWGLKGEPPVTNYFRPVVSAHRKPAMRARSTLIRSRPQAFTSSIATNSAE